MSYQRLIIPLLILSLILTLFGCGGLGLTPALPEGQEKGILCLDPTNLNLTPSEDFTVELKTASITNLKGYSVTLSYDPALLSLQGVAEGPFLSAEGKTFFYKKVDDDKGIILIDCAILGTEVGVSGEGTLATFSFTSLKAGSTSIELSLARVRDTYTPSALIPGDFGGINNGPSDGVVDFEDLMIFAMAYGSAPSDSNWNPICDIAGPDGKLTPDGVIDFEDLMVFAMNYGEEETMVPDYTRGLSWVDSVDFDGETYLKGGETYGFVLAFDYVITDPELRYVKIMDYSNPTTPGIIFYEFMTLADLTTDDNMVFYGSFTPPSICDSGISGARPINGNGEEGGEYCTPAYVEVYGLGANCCAPCRYKFNVDATLPKAEIKITVKDCCGWAFLEFNSMPITCDGYCCGDECTELAGWAIDIFETMPVYYCGELITEEKCHFEGEGCPVKVEMLESDCSACCLKKPQSYWIITTLEDSVGNLNHYYVLTVLFDTTDPVDLITVEFYGFNPDFWVWDGTEGDNPFKDIYTLELINDIFGDPCPWELLDCATTNHIDPNNHIQ